MYGSSLVFTRHGTQTYARDAQIARVASQDMLMSHSDCVMCMEKRKATFFKSASISLELTEFIR
jgi:hypothetical protein